MATETILSSPFIKEIVLPFVLVFTLVFAILEKTKILGEDKRQISAIISLAVGLITVTYAYATGIIVQLMPFLAVVLVVIFVFMLLWGFVASDKEKGLVMNKGLKITFGILIAVALIVAVISVTGAWDLILNSYGNSFFVDIVFIAVIGGVLAVVISGGGKSGT